jgi:hypothetical protein
MSRLCSGKGPKFERQISKMAGVPAWILITIEFFALPNGVWDTTLPFVFRV